MSKLTYEKIANAIKATDYKYFGDYEMTDKQRDAVEVLVDAAVELMLSDEKEAAWISVDDSLPHSICGTWSDPVIAMSDLGLIYKLSYFNSEDSGCWQRTQAFAWSQSKSVTHWMPLPQPPKDWPRP